MTLAFERTHAALAYVAKPAILALAALVGVASAQANTVRGELTLNSPRFDRDAARDGAPCTADLNNVYAYNAYSLSHSGGDLTVEMLGQAANGGSLSDPYLFLYSAPLNPAAPCQSYMTHNDDRDDDDTYDAQIAFNGLAAGNYVIIATSYDEYDEADEDGGEVTARATNLGLGSYTLVSNQTLANITPAPATAVSVPVMGEWGIAGLAILLGAAGVVATRRKQQTT